MSGLSGMWVDPVEIELPRDKEDDRAHGMNAGIATGFTFGRLEQPIERFEESVGLAGLCPSHDAVEMIADHSGDLLHWFDLGSHHVGTPLREHGGHDIDLFAVEDFAQLFTVEPGTSSTLGRDVSDQGIQVGRLTGGEITSVFEQRPAQAFQGGIGLLLDAAHLVDRSRGMGDDMELVESNARIRQVVCDSLDEGGRHVDAGRIDLAGIAAMGRQMLGKRLDRLGITPLCDEDDLALFRVSDQG